MGDLNVMLKKANHWTDRLSQKHKHVFTEPCIVIIKENELYKIPQKNYKACKCEFCKSFIKAERTDIIDLDLQVMLFEKPHYALGFKDLTYVGDF